MAVPKDKVSQVDKVTIRVIAPRLYRQVFAQKQNDSPVQVISQLAANTQIQLAGLTGGTWNEQSIGNKKQFTGYLRINTKQVVQTSAQCWLVCSKGRRMGTPSTFNRTECVNEPKPIGDILFRELSADQQFE